MLAVLRAVDETKSEEEKDDWEHEAESERHTPDTVVDVLVVGCEHNKGYYAGYNESEIDGEVCGYGYEHPTLAADVLD